MKAFKAILFEMGSNSLDNALRQNVGTSGTNRRGGKSSIAKAKNFSNLYYTTKEGENEFNIYTMKNFTLDSVQNMRSEIKESMDEERISLEKEIVKLNNEMDNQSESVAYGCDESASLTSLNTSFLSLDLSSLTCTVCKKPSTRVDPARTNKLGTQFVCSICKKGSTHIFRNNESHESMIQDFSKKLMLSSQSEAMLSSSNNSNSYLTHSSSTSNDYLDDSSPHPHPNNNDSSPVSFMSVPVSSRSTLSSGGRGSSKFRSRLNSARDELHFLDEF